MATETILSPGVLLQETDNTLVFPGIDPSGMAIIGPTARGPVEIPTQVTNYQQFKRIFGTTIRSGSQAYELFTNLSVKNYFNNGGSSALIVRVVSGSTSWGAASNTHISSSDALTGVNTQPFTLETLGKGADFNSSAGTDGTDLVETQNANGSLVNGTKDNLRFEVSNINNAAGTFTLIIRRGDDTRSNPIVLESFTNVSLDPLSTNYIARAVGDQVQSVNADGDAIDVEGEFPNNSEFVRVKAVNLPTYKYLNNDGSVGTDAASISYSASLPIALSGSFFGGTGNNYPATTFGRYGSSSGAEADAEGTIQGLQTSDYTTAITLLKNKEEFKFKTLVVPGLNKSNHGTTLDSIIENTEVRGDNIFVLDLVPYGSTRTTVKNNAESLDTSFAAAYWPWAQVRSSGLNKNVWAPASTIIPGVYAQNDSLAAPWFAPAGLTRGGLRNVPKVETKLSKEQRDELYTSKVNPLATFPGQGVVVFGQKTLQQATSALDRVNVRRLLLDVKDTINGFAQNIVFEQNTDATRSRFIRRATPYLESLVQRQGLFAFQVKMDGQLNTSEVIDENKLVGQVFLQPTRTAEFIVLDFTLTPTGASFED